MNKLDSIFKQYPELNIDGIHYNLDLVFGKTKQEKEDFVNVCKQRLLSRKTIIIQISEILRKYIIPTKTIRKFCNSYQMKHIIEKRLSSFGIDEFSISNGELIAAALLAGFKCKECSKKNCNVYFNMQQKSFEQTFHVQNLKYYGCNDARDKK